MKLKLIFNPRSGRQGRNAGILPMLRDYLGRAGTGADLAITEGPGHATELAREAVAAGFDRVVAVGGDGTLNEVAQALIHAPAVLGLVPCGSGNGLALHLGLPKRPAEALALAVASPARVAELDTGTVNGLLFVNAMGVGLDADVARRFNGLTRRGLPAYARTALAAFFSRKTERCRIIAGHRQEDLDAMLVSVANSDQYGNHAKIAPHARVDDGVLDLVAVKPVGLFGAGVIGVRLFLGNLDQSRRVLRLSGPRFRILRDAAGVVHTDGETHMAAAEIEVAVLPRSLRMVVPPACAVVAPASEQATAGFALRIP
jgi:YegS/Rv2252/BmrU family lipid kinase